MFHELTVAIKNVGRRFISLTETFKKPSLISYQNKEERKKKFQTRKNDFNKLSLTYLERHLLTIMALLNFRFYSHSRSVMSPERRMSKMWWWWWWYSTKVNSLKMPRAFPAVE
ncbi:hypothetical protein CEXT_491811 [Caerostris extrusa]|uniref:Uncharacterized protein n=1 Tax=Caerostris extrusa TaxID=172846 RepID=A0AAV4S5I0_CAEEX|nr:hypothetical protein CEXT_491811 [Caerostris extrusa]